MIRFNRNLLVFGLITGVTMLNVGCEVEAEVKVEAPGLKVDAKIKVKTAGLAFVDTVPDYSVQFEGYPYNRIVLTATVTRYRDKNGNVMDTPVTEPMELQPGQMLSAQVRIGATVLPTLFTVVKQSSLPAGSYLLDSPGFLCDAVEQINAQAGCNMTWNFGSSAKPALLPKAIFSSYEYCVYDAIDPDFSIYMDPTSTAVIGTIQTAKPPKPGIIHPTE